MRANLNRLDYVLAVLSAGGVPAQFTPGQAQKLFFLLDREIPGFVGGPHFNFTPYDYGPFDKEVYEALDRLACEKYVQQVGCHRHRRYLLTADGFQRGQDVLSGLPEELRSYISSLSTWVRSLSFAQLMSEIYRLYPDMKVNSVFQ